MFIERNRKRMSAQYTLIQASKAIAIVIQLCRVKTPLCSIINKYKDVQCCCKVYPTWFW